MVVPPSDTRAYFTALAAVTLRIRSLNWDGVEFEVDGTALVDLKKCVDMPSAAYYNAALDSALLAEHGFEKLAAWEHPEAAQG